MTLLLVSSALVTGWIRHWQATAVRSPHDLRLIIAEQAPIVTVEGWIRSPPTVKVRSTEPGPAYTSQVILELNRIQIGHQWIKAVGRLAVKADEALHPDLYQNGTIRVRGVVSKPALPHLRGGFDYRRYLRLHRIHYEMRLKTWSSRLEILDLESGRPLPAQFQEWARQSLALGQPNESAAVRLIWAMALGWRTWLTPDARQPFMQSGTMHLFAISGLHIALIAGLLVVIGKCLGLRRRHAGFIIIPSLWLYVLATGSPASAVRASTGATIVLLGWMLRRPPNTINSIGTAALVILVIQPLQLFQAGFQLSFTVALSLTLLYPKLTSWGQRFWKSASMTPNSLKSKYQQWVVRGVQKVYASLAVSMAAWLGSLPLIALYFNLVTPISILANLILVPLAALVLASVLMSLFFAAWCPFISVLCNSSAWFWMTAMMRCCDQFAATPGGHLNVSAPSLTLIVIYYLLLLAWVTIRKRAWQWSATLVCAGLLIVQVILNDYRHRRVTTLHILPIPDGDAIFIDQPGTTDDWMIDGGPLWCRKRFVQPFLLTSPRSANYQNHLLTHGDKSHIEILESMIADDSSSRIVVASRTYRSQFYRQLLRRWEEEGHSIETRTPPFKIGPWQILHPQKQSPVSPADDGVLVLLGRIDSFRVLLLSDLDRSVINELFHQDPTLTTDIICLNLPNRPDSPNQFVLRRLDPQLLIVSGSDSQRGASWVRSLSQTFNPKQTQVLFTGTSGAIELTVQQTRAQVTTSRGQTITLFPRQ